VKFSNVRRVLARRGTATVVVLALAATGLSSLPASAGESAGDPAAPLDEPVSSAPVKEGPRGSAAGKSHVASARATAATRQFAAPADPAPANPIPPPGPGGSRIDGPAQLVPGDAAPASERATSTDVAEKRGHDTKVFANTDGTFTAEIHSKPIHFRNDAGKWKDIDPTLLVTPSGRARNAAGPMKVDVAEKADDPALAKVVTEAGQAFAYGLADAAAAPASIDRSVAMYRDVLPNVDVRLSVQDAGVKEDLILRSPDAPRRFVFPLLLDGLTAAIDAETSGVVLRDGDGDVALRIPRGWMQDSNYDPRADESPKSDGVHYALIDHGTGTALEVTLDGAWLDDPTRVYPVTVDPTTVDYVPGQDDTYVATNQTWNGASESELKAGTWDPVPACAGNWSPGCGGAHFHQSYLHFNGANALNGMHVLSAQLNIYETWSASCAARGLGVYRVTEGWGPMTNYPGAIFDDSVKAWASFAMGYSAACPAGTASFDVTEFVDGWAANRYANFGLTMRVDPGSENDLYAWKKFASYDNNVSPDPYIRVTYSPYNAAYQCGPPTPCRWTTDVRPQSPGSLPITLTNTGHDTWPANGNYRLAYHVLAADNTTVVQWDGARTFLPTAVAPGQSITLEATVAPLPAGTYHLHFDMVNEGVTWFSYEGVPKLDIPVTVFNPNPTITAVAPMANLASGTLTPTLAVSAVNNNPAYGAVSFEYKLCADVAMTVECLSSGTVGATTWTVPYSTGMRWGKTYYWQVKVSDGASLSTVTTPIPLTTVPTQPTTSLHLGADPYSSGLGGVSPANGNFATTVTDVAPAAAGPTLAVTRTYNSQDPRVLPFGIGWSTPFDMRADGQQDGSVVVSYPDGHQVRFGQNPDGTYAPAPGYGATLTPGLQAGLILTDNGGVQYSFTANGELAQVADADGLTKTLTYDPTTGHVVTVTSSAGRSLHLTWAGLHVTEVATDPVSTNGNAPYKWQYSYTGDRLTQVCNALVVGPRCTTYGSQSVTGTKVTSPYAKAVLADNPKAYWRMDDTNTVLADFSGNGLNGTYNASGVTKNSPGGLPNDPDKAVSLNGTAGYATAPSGFADFTGGLTIEAWVNPTSNANFGRVVDLGNGASSDNIVFYRLGTSTDLGLAVYRGSTAQFLNAPNALQLNTFQHIAVTLTSAGVATIYRNGQAVATGPMHLPNNVTRTSNFIGKSNWAGESLWSGKVDDVAVYDHAVTPESISAHYAQAQGPVRPTSASLLSSIALPRGNVSQTIHYATDQTVDYRKDGVLEQWSFAATTAADTAVRTTTVTDPLTRTTKWRHDPQGRLIERVDELGNSRRFSYDPSANVLTRMVDENGHVVAFTHDGRGNVLTRTTAQTSAYADGVVNDGALGYWRLGEANGTAAEDASGHGLDGTYIGGYALAQSGGLGDLDTAAGFDGVTGYVSLPSGFANFTQGLTVEAWVYPTSNGSYARIVDLGNGSSSDNIILFRDGTTTSLGLQVFRGSSPQFLIAPNALILNSWQHVAATITSTGAASIYRNAQLVATGTVQVPKNLTRTANFIGKSNWQNDALWQGRLDEVALYGSALSNNTIADHYNQGKAPGGQTTAYDYFSPYASDVLADGPTAYWRLGDRSGSDLYDASEHGRTGFKGVGVGLGAPSAMSLDGDAATSFNGAAGSNVTASLPMPQTNATLEAWVNLPDLSRSGAFVQVGAGGNGYGLGVGGGSTGNETPGNHLVGLYENVRWIDSGVNIGTGWHHVAMTIGSTGTATFFLDGAQVAQSAGAGPLANVGPIVAVGGYTGPGSAARWFSGTLDEVAVYSTALSGARIASHFAKGSATVATDPRLNKMTAVRDARSSWRYDNTYRTRYAYDAVGHLVSKITPATSDFPAGRTTTWAYTTGTEPGFGAVGTQPKGLLKTATTPRATATSYTYDSKGDLRRVVDPVGLDTTFAYDDVGRRTSAVEVSDTFPAGLTTAWEYDELSRVLNATEPGAPNSVTNVVHTPKTTFIYDGNGNVTDTTLSDTTGGDASRHSSFSYDNNERVLTSTNAATETTAYTYDDVGNIATVTDGRGTVTRLDYTPRSQLATKTALGFVDDPITPGTPRDVVLESRAYDPAGRLASSTDALGRTTEFAYFNNDLLNKTTLKGFHEAGGAIRDIVMDELTYDAAGNVVKEVTNGRTTQVAGYDAAGRLASSTLEPNSLNRLTAFAYDANDNVKSASLSGGGRTELTSRTYDLADRLANQTVDNDVTADLVTTYTRDKRGALKSVRDPRGNATTLSVDALGRTAFVTSPGVPYEANGAPPVTSVQRTYFGFNTFGDKTDGKNPNGVVVHTAYDDVGRVTDVTYPAYVPVTGTTITPTERWTYDANSNVGSFTDRRSQTTTFDYDKLNRVVRVTEPKLAAQPTAGTRRLAYDDVGNVTSATDVLGALVQATYDDLDRTRTSTVVERVPAPTKTYSTTMAYDDAGNVTSVTNPTLDVTTAQYNAADELISVTDARLHTTTIGRDLAGRATVVTDPLNRSERMTYDVAGRVTKVEHYDRTSVLLDATSFGSDLNGNATSVTTPLGWTTTQVFDAVNRLTSITEPISAADSMTTSFAYDRAGNRSRVTNGRGFSTITKYQVWDLPREVVEQAGTWSTTYDAGGLVAQTTTPDGVVRARTYDELGRLTQEASTGGGAAAPSAARTLGYDLLNLKTVNHPTGTESFNYDDQGHVVGASGPASTTSFVYNGDGEMTRRSDSVGAATFTYDRTHNLKTAVDPATGTTATFTYNDANQRTAVTNGTGNASRAYAYDDRGRQVGDTLTSGAGSTLASVAYGYDLDSNVTSKTVGPAGFAGAGANTYAYDRAERLASWTNPVGVATPYGWDKASNRIAAGAATYNYDGDNRLTSEVVGGVTTATYSYTARGTLSAKTGAGAGTFTFDGLDRMVADGTRAYTYDGLDRMVSAGGIAFKYAGAEKEPSNDGASSFARGPYGELIGMSTGGVGTKLLSDGRGDVVGTYSPGGAAMTSSRAYDPWGTPTAFGGGGGGGVGPAVGYQGSWTDATTGRVSMQARFYTPGMATFASRDSFEAPISSGASANKFAYAGANPLKFTDPTGQFATGEGYRTTALLDSAGFNPFMAPPGAASELVDTIRAGFRNAAGIASAVVGTVVAGARIGADIAKVGAGLFTKGVSGLSKAGEAVVTAPKVIAFGVVVVLVSVVANRQALWKHPASYSEVGPVRWEIGADSTGTPPTVEQIAELMRHAAPPGPGSGGVPVPPSTGPSIRITRSSGSSNPLGALKITIPGVGSFQFYPSASPDARITHDSVERRAATAAPVQVDAADGQQVVVANADSLNMGGGGGGGQGGPDNNPCQVKPGGGLQSCAPPPPDFDRKEPEAKPQPSTAGAGARQGGGGKSGRRGPSWLDWARSSVRGSTNSELAGKGIVDSSTIRFTQSSVSRRFGNGALIEDLAADLRNGTIRPTDVPPIRIFQRNEQWFTLDNRRLLAFQQAGIDVPYRRATPAEVGAEAWKFTTTNGGTSIRIRGGGGTWP
jgi:RHS repeat-associated protein